MPEQNKKLLNEQFTTLLKEILDTQRQIIVVQEEIKNAIAKKSDGVSEDIWKAI